MMKNFEAVLDLAPTIATEIPGNRLECMNPESGGRADSTARSISVLPQTCSCSMFLILLHL